MVASCNMTNILPVSHILLHSPEGSSYKLQYMGNSKNICHIMEGRRGTAYTKNGLNTP